MKQVTFFLLLSSLLLTSCMSNVYQLRTDCRMNRDEAMESINTILIRSGFDVKLLDSKVGFISAEKEGSMSGFMGVHFNFKWQFNVGRRGDVTAHCQLITTTRNAWGNESGRSTRYCDDDTHSDLVEYWEVRTGLANLCPGLTVVDPDELKQIEEEKDRLEREEKKKQQEQEQSGSVPITK